ncbi:MAG: T9SS type A sorting domain-containing protein [Calditrichaceae bacterium]|jgi:hypothetical protein
MRKFIKPLLLICILLGSNIQAGEWEIISEMPIPVKGAKAVEHNSLIYIIGGYSDSTYSPINKIQVYNPEENSWVIIDDTLNIARYGHCVVYDGEKAYIFGGGIKGDSLDRSLETWDFVTSPVITGYDPSFNRQFAAAEINNNHIYIFGGYGTESVSDTAGMPYMVVYDLGTEKVIYHDQELFDRDNTPIHQLSAIIPPYIYLFGGIIWGLSQDAYIYNISEETFYSAPNSLGIARAGGCAIKIERNLIALIGGYDEVNFPIASVEFFDVFDGYINSRYVYNELIYARAEPAVVLHDSFTYVFGGRDSLDNCIPYVEKAYLEGSATSLENMSPSYPPDDFQLYQNYPNPFNPATTIVIKNLKSMHAQLDIFSIDGSHVKTLMNKNLEAGQHRYTWDGTDEQHKPVSSGLYFYKLYNGFESVTKRMILLR